MKTKDDLKVGRINIKSFTEGSFYLRRENVKKNVSCEKNHYLFIVEWKLKSPYIGQDGKKLGKLLDSTYPIRKLPLQKET